MANSRSKQLRNGFTLVELMISIALVLFLMVGINKVFKATTDTVGAGFAIGTIAREQRSSEPVMARDFSRAVPPREAPFIIIQSGIEWAFVNRADYDSDQDKNPTTYDFNNNGGPELPILPTDYSIRNHRVDRIGFFARDVDFPFGRQTGRVNGPELITAANSPEAYIWYGHLKQPNNKTITALNPRQYNGAVGDYFDPGQSTPDLNPNNFFVEQWAFGRVALLLSANPTSTDFIAVDPLLPMSPLEGNSKAMSLYPPSFPGPAFAPDGSNWVVQYSRFDLAATSIKAFHTLMTPQITLAAPMPVWFGTVGPPETRAWQTRLNYRFNCRPWASRSSDIQLTATELALTTPHFQKGVGQFIVEYAGDFITQDNNPASPTYGRFTAAVPDGVLDFAVEPPLKLRKTRWYGMPRNVSAADDGGGPNIVGNGPTENMIDVVPLRDLIGAAVPWEHFYVSNPSPPPILPPMEIVPNSIANYATGMPASGVYMAAWAGRDLTPTVAAPRPGPWMVRLVLQLTDPTRRLPDGQTFEYVYSLPQ